jgi:redox-sensitive bicupin YhaK (pirin superfamily)
MSWRMAPGAMKPRIRGRKGRYSTRSRYSDASARQRLAGTADCTHFQDGVVPPHAVVVGLARPYILCIANQREPDMFEIRRANERGHANHGWLDSYHSFSFAGYNDPKHVHFGALRVINEDRVAGGQGFGTHGHRDMEIISYVLEGGLAHRDSMGNGSTIRPGDVQRMSAGTGVRHSEFNGSPTETAHFLQIWIIPAKEGDAPGYEEKHFDDAEKRGRLRVIASPQGRDGAVKLGADAEVYAALIDGDERVEFDVPAGRRVYVHVARGAVSVNGEALVAGDAAKMEAVQKVTFEKGTGAEVILFDLA